MVRATCGFSTRQASILPERLLRQSLSTGYPQLLGRSRTGSLIDANFQGRFRAFSSRPAGAVSEPNVAWLD